MSTRKRQTRPDTSSTRLAALLKKSGTLEAAVAELHQSLKAMKSHYDSASGSWISEPDGATRIKAIEIALNFAVGSPVKRQQILSGRIPDAPLDREQLRDTVDRRIAAMLEQPDLSATELLTLKKTLAEQEADAPKPKLSEAEKDAEIRRVLGIDDPYPIT